MHGILIDRRGYGMWRGHGDLLLPAAAGFVGKRRTPGARAGLAAKSGISMDPRYIVVKP
jgi:hypothetical protein